MGFDPALVRRLIVDLKIGSNHVVLDPFCGAGTTLVECKRHGIESIGIDANPVCALATRVKTHWSTDRVQLATRLPAILRRAQQLSEGGASVASRDQSVLASAAAHRRWITSRKFRKVLAIDAAIRELCHNRSHRDFYRLALFSAVVRKIADIKFGPEVYCLPRRGRRRVFGSFANSASTMLADLTLIQRDTGVDTGAHVVLGDARSCHALIRPFHRHVDFILTSPPYPNEHDYTRCTRLELILLGHLRTTAGLRRIKRRMVRCHSKGVYVGDNERTLVSRNTYVRSITKRLERSARGRSDGFSRVMPRVPAEYFGGMYSHLASAFRALKPGGVCAYVVCDQQSLLGVYINTPRVLTNIATSRRVGFRLVDTIAWKRTHGSTGKRELTERIVILRKPPR